MNEYWQCIELEDTLVIVAIYTNWLQASGCFAYTNTTTLLKPVSPVDKTNTNTVKRIFFAISIQIHNRLTKKLIIRYLQGVAHDLSLAMQ